jgi:alanine dehydrogenase
MMPGIIGIRREDKSRWERRVPFAPRHVKALVNQGFDMRIQPSKIRVFKDEEYDEVGATVQEDLSKCDVVFGIKEFPINVFRDGQAYMYFAHVIKGQPKNMPMLRALMDTGCTLVDYEKVTDENNRRLIFFGNYAGLAGMLEAFYTLGKRLEWEGVATPFLGLRRPLHYGSLDEAKAALEVVARWMEKEGLPESLTPLVVGFAGYGNVSKGAQEIFDLLPHEEVQPKDLDSFIKNAEYSNRKLYKVVFYEKDMVEPLGDQEFDLQGYFGHPENYTGVFGQYLPNLTLLVNCIYWDERYPRLVTKKWLRENWTSNTKLRVIGDISCDIEGSIECTLKATEPGDPIFTYLPETNDIKMGWEGDGPVIMAVDILPSELPREASLYFGDLLTPFVPAIAKAEYAADFTALDLPPVIKRAVIVHKGRLTPDYEYIEGFL